MLNNEVHMLYHALFCRLTALPTWAESERLTLSNAGGATKVWDSNNGVVVLIDEHGYVGVYTPNVHHSASPERVMAWLNSEGYKRVSLHVPCSNGELGGWHR